MQTAYRQQIAEAAGALLVWKHPTATRREYSLLAGEEPLATLAVRGWFGRGPATAASVDGIWAFAPRGWWSPSVTVTSAGPDGHRSTLGKWKRAFFSTARWEGTLELSSGQRYAWLGWGPPTDGRDAASEAADAAWYDAAGTPLVRFGYAWGGPALAWCGLLEALARRLSGEPSATVGPGPDVPVEVAPAARGCPDLALLVVLGRYLLDSAAYDSSRGD